MTFVLDDDHLDFQRETRRFARTELLEGYHARAGSTQF
ncbi:MAG: hypothetical protein QOD04_4584, partial [Pseudonocardiales bacterium]|nr:hypothetical protein [Pseudonocardiales bacterium]